MKNRMKIALTGSSGYIGNYLTGFFEKKQHLVYKLCRKKNYPGDIFFELGKENDYRSLNGIDVLIHCAFDFSIKNYEESKKINLYGTLDLFENAKKIGVKKIIYFSSLSAFENASSEYGRLKYKIEAQVKQFDSIIVRPGLVFNKESKGAIGIFINSAKLLPIVRLKEKTFHPCHLEDLANLINYLILHDIKLNLPIPAASEQALSFQEFIQKLASYQNKKVKLLPLPYHIVYPCLKIIESLKIHMNIRSDSLKNMRSYNPKINFNIAKEMGAVFRPL